jgi:hypothetical protein
VVPTETGRRRLKPLSFELKLLLSEIYFNGLIWPHQFAKVCRRGSGVGRNNDVDGGRLKENPYILVLFVLNMTIN